MTRSSRSHTLVAVYETAWRQLDDLRATSVCGPRCGMPRGLRPDTRCVRKDLKEGCDM
jgi:hypothetical protein